MGKAKKPKKHRAHRFDPVGSRPDGSTAMDLDVQPVKLSAHRQKHMERKALQVRAFHTHGSVARPVPRTRTIAAALHVGAARSQQAREQKGEQGQPSRIQGAKEGAPTRGEADTATGGAAETVVKRGNRG